VLDQVREWVGSIGKTPITVRNVPGFATSRLDLIASLEAMRMLQDGVASADDIDRAAVLAYRHPVGPLRLSDIVGLDVRLDIARAISQSLGVRYAPPRMDEALAYARAHCADVPWIALSLYPQYSFATSRSSLREMTEQLSAAERAQTRFICAYPEDPQYLAAMADLIEQTLAAQPPQIRAQTHLLEFFHGQFFALGAGQMLLADGGKGDVFPHAQTIKQRAALKQHAEFMHQRVAIIGGEFRGLGAINTYGAAGRGKQA
jgi:hypothetical protein